LWTRRRADWLVRRCSRINSLDERYYAEHFAGGRRFDGAAEASRSQAQVLPTISRPRR
jgi:hypothetical protein